MSPVALAECLRRFIAQVVHFSCCVVGAVRNFFFFFYKCKWRHGLIAERKRALSMLSNIGDGSVPSLPVHWFYFL